MKNVIKMKIVLFSTIRVVLVIALMVYPIIRGNTKAEFDSFVLYEVEHPKYKQLRGDAYNELLVVYRYFNNIEALVYNDINRPLISESDFEKIDTVQLAKSLNAMKVVKNGPRFWTMDKVKGYYKGDAKVLAGFTMNSYAIVPLTIKTLTNREPYTIRNVERKSSYIYEKGLKIYQITTDKNEKYIMQSASREIDKNMSFEQLDNLASRLNLPDGWKYEVKVLNEDLICEIDGMAYLIQDDFNNSYQKITN